MRFCYHLVSFAFLFFLYSCSDGEGSMESLCIDTSGDSNKTAQYKITFDATWSSDSHPTKFPSNAHFSKLVGASHSDAYSMWKGGAKASSGVKEVAEKGETSVLMKEMDTAKSAKTLCGYKIAASGIKKSPGKGEITVTAHEDFSLLSLITMIAPSPDWFVGFSAVNLREGGDWITSKTLEAMPWDGGSDKGSDYDSDNDPLDAQEAISEITGEPFLKDGVVAPLGTFTIEKL